MKRVSGFSLVELLIAMTLGLLLLAGTVAVFAGNKRSSEVSTALANLQENARFALDAIASDARMAGFQGCIDINKGSINTRAATPPTTDLRLTAAAGSVVDTPTSWSPSPPGFDPNLTSSFPAVPGSHALTLQYGGPQIATLRAQMELGGHPSPSGPLPLTGNNDDGIDEGARLGLAVGDYAIVSNCDTGDLFRVTSVAGSPQNIGHAASASDNTGGALTRAYGDDRTRDQTMVMRFSANIYYIGETGLSNAAGDKVRALYRQTLPYSAANPPTELIQGVEQMRIAFGVRNAAGTLSYVLPGATGYDPARIETLRVGLLTTSWEEISDADDDRTYQLAGQPIHASDDVNAKDAHPRDRRMRVAFNTTVRIRNRRNGT